MRDWNDPMKSTRRLVIAGIAVSGGLSLGFLSLLAWAVYRLVTHFTQ